MRIKALLRRFALSIISQPRANVHISLQQIKYGDILKNKSIVIIGGSKGIGLAIAKKVASEGARVLITGRNQDRLIKAITEIGANSDYIVFDNSNTREINSFVDKCFQKLEYIDDLIINAGISLHEGDIMNVTQESYDQQFDVNLKASYFIAQAFLRRKLIDNQISKWCNLLFISSETAGKSNDLPYGLTKAALNSLVGGLARRVYNKGIRVNAIAPGVTLTDMKDAGSVDKSSDMSLNNAAGRWLLAEEIAEIACFMLSRVSNCINGEVIYCDAGNHLKVNGLESEYAF